MLLVCDPEELSQTTLGFTGLFSGIPTTGHWLSVRVLTSLGGHQSIDQISNIKSSRKVPPLTWLFSPKSAWQDGVPSCPLELHLRISLRFHECLENCCLGVSFSLLTITNSFIGTSFMWIAVCLHIRNHFLRIRSKPAKAWSIFSASVWIVLSSPLEKVLAQSVASVDDHEYFNPLTFRYNQLPSYPEIKTMYFQRCWVQDFY